MSWIPNADGVRELISVLRDSTSDDSAVQAQVTKRLESFESIPDYPGYLVHILTQASQEDERFRAVAGLLLKNNLASLSSSSPQVVAYVKASVLSALGDPNAMVRQTVGTVIVSILTAEGVQAWTEALGTLVVSLDSSNVEEQEGAFSTLAKICEDLPKQLDLEINGQRLLDFMIPRFITFTDHPNHKFRSQAIGCLNSFVVTNPPSFATNIDSFFTALFRRASDENSDVRKSVCQALTLLLTARPDKVVPELSNVADFMIYSMQDKDEAVALEACEFWLGFAESDDLKEHLRPFLSKVAPVLLKGMVYTEADLIWLDGEEDDAAVPDRAEDIRPKHYGGKGHGFEHDESEGGALGGGGKSRALGEDEDEDEDEDDYDDDEDDDDDFSSEWNLRKCSAAALDVMSVVFETELLEILLPHLKEKLFDSDWVNRECGILALGAMAEGCLDGITPHLPTLIPFLINTLSDTKPLVRAITCWTIGRYSSWCVNAQTPEEQAQFFLPAMESLLKMVLDNNKRVQEAGCSAFATLEEEAGSLLQPFLEPIVRNLVFAFSKYQQKNLLILYDAIGTLADSVQEGLNNPGLIEILMPPLIAKWNALDDDDEDIIPLLECLSSVTIAAAESFAGYTIPVYERCLKIIQKSLSDYWQMQSGAAVEEPDKTFLIVALDLLSGLTQGLKENMSALMSPAGTPEGTMPLAIQLLENCLNHPEHSVRQSAYALLGDISISCPSLSHYLPLYLPRIAKEIADQVQHPKYEEVSVCNNAAWALGEIAMQCRQANEADPAPPLRAHLEPHVQGLTECLVGILLNTTTPKSLLENAAVTIGRLGLIYPEIVSVPLASFGKQWCTTLWDIKDNDEKASAFLGFCRLCMTNPPGIVPDLIYLCNAICKWTTPSAQLNDTFRQVLTSFKEMLGETWNANFPTFPPALQERLRSRYQL